MSFQRTTLSLPAYLSYLYTELRKEEGNLQKLRLEHLFLRASLELSRASLEHALKDRSPDCSKACLLKNSHLAERISNCEAVVRALQRQINQVEQSTSPSIQHLSFGLLQVEARALPKDKKIVTVPALKDLSEFLLTLSSAEEQAERHFSKRLRMVRKLTYFVATHAPSFQEHQLRICLPSKSLLCTLAPMVSPDSYSSRAHISILPHLIVRRPSDPRFYYVVNPVPMPDSSLPLDIVLNACDVTRNPINDLDCVLELPTLSLLLGLNTPAVRVAFVQNLNSLATGNLTCEEVINRFKAEAVKSFIAVEGFLVGRYPLPSQGRDRYEETLVDVLKRLEFNRYQALSCLQRMRFTLLSA